MISESDMVPEDALITGTRIDIRKVKQTMKNTRPNMRPKIRPNRRFIAKMRTMPFVSRFSMLQSFLILKPADSES